MEKVRSFAGVDEEVDLWDCDVLWTWVVELTDGVLFTEVPKIVVWIALVCKSTLFLFPDWFLELCKGIGNGTMTGEEWAQVFTDWSLISDEHNFAGNNDYSNTTCLDIMHFLVCIS